MTPIAAPKICLSLTTVRKSAKLADVCYDIRGPVLGRAKQMEDEGQCVLKLNIGNLAPFGFQAPDVLQHSVIENLANAAGYADSRGLVAARESIVRYAHDKGIRGVSIDDVIIGNGVSELIVMAMQGLLDDGDEVLVPAPDYPLWTAAVSLAGGRARHYLCDEEAGWLPALEDIQKKITARTRAIVVINPNNPTGAVYPRDLLERIVEIARRNQLIVFSDEIYDKTLYEDISHTSLASLADDVFFITFNGLSKNYRACGYRTGWMVISGERRHAVDYLEGLSTLASMRLCANVPSQYAVPAALNGYQSIRDLVGPGGRLRRQRDLAHELITQIPGVSCVKPSGALYLFPRLDSKIYPIADDQAFILELLESEKVLVVQGSGFNWPAPDHLRLVFLPEEDELREAMARIARFLDGYRNRQP